MIKVGDEVVFTGSRAQILPPRRFVVTEVTSINNSKDILISGIGPSGDQYCLKNSDYWKPTGRYFPEVEVLLEKLKEETK